MVPLVQNAKHAKYLNIWEKKFNNNMIKKKCRNTLIYIPNHSQSRDSQGQETFFVPLLTSKPATMTHNAR